MDHVHHGGCRKKAPLTTPDSSLGILCRSRILCDDFPGCARSGIFSESGPWSSHFPGSSSEDQCHQSSVMTDGRRTNWWTPRQIYFHGLHQRVAFINGLAPGRERCWIPRSSQSLLSRHKCCCVQMLLFIQQAVFLPCSSHAGSRNLKLCACNLNGIALICMFPGPSSKEHRWPGYIHFVYWFRFETSNLAYRFIFGPCRCHSPLTTRVRSCNSITQTSHF